MSHTVKALLMQARSLIADPQCWTQGTWARDRAGNGAIFLIPEDDAAVCWCMVGALIRTTPHPKDRYKAEWALRHVIEVPEAVVTGHLAVWNDMPGRTHEEVMQAFDAAIEKCGSLNWGEGENTSTTIGDY
jgi:hypothetical protein